MRTTKIGTILKLLPVAAVAATLCATSAHAQLTLNAATSSSTVALTGSDAGTLAAGGTASASYFFGPGNIDKGTVTSSVYTGDSNNPLTGNTYIYAVTISGGGLATLEFTANWGTSVYLGFGQSSTSINSAATAGYNAALNTVTFSLGGDLTSGTYYLVVGTADTTIVNNSVGLIDSGIGSASPVLTPTPVPEASTLMAGALMVLPLGIGAIRAIRKERAA